MNVETAKRLVDISIFDTARNVYYLMLISKECNVKPEDLVDSIHQVRQMKADKKFVKHLFEALLDCSSMEEQTTLIVYFFDSLKTDKDPFIALSKALNYLDLCTSNMK